MVTNLKAEKATVLENLQLVRGPYLQVGNESSLVIRWATHTPVQSRVWYGVTPDNLCFLQEGTTIGCNHSVKLDGLTPDTKYFYAIGTPEGVIAGGTEDYSFVTAPALDLAPEDVRPLRILVLGDAGRANDIAASVRDGYLKFTGTRHTDLWLMLGDNAYEIGTYEEYQRAIFEMYPQLLRSSVLWTAIGNHDGGCADSTTQTGPYYELFSMPTCGEAGGLPSGTAAYYSFDWGNVHFVCLDSYGCDRIAHQSDRVRTVQENLRLI
ncbi:MAG: metallophosphoesterase family protein [Scytonema sp. PMC 1069.18]|nr:metallophosphoesterase family protein [Scytonema sp. PMC 1069.18]MEC4888374.1 metallophosphoesterase family protein [Scytonema sp. PMC 1070.18]